MNHWDPRNIRRLGVLALHNFARRTGAVPAPVPIPPPVPIPAPIPAPIPPPVPIPAPLSDSDVSVLYTDTDVSGGGDWILMPFGNGYTYMWLPEGDDDEIPTEPVPNLPPIRDTGIPPEPEYTIIGPLAPDVPPYRQMRGAPGGQPPQTNYFSP